MVSHILRLQKCVRDGIYDEDELKFDSKWELAYYRYCKANNFQIERQPLILEFTYNNKVKKYKPDFRINGQLVEIKGDHFFENHNKKLKMICPYDRSKDDLYEAKHQCMLANNVKILTYADLKEMKVFDYFS